MKRQFASWISILTIQDANSIVIWNVQPKVQSKIFSVIRTNMMNVPQRVVLQLLGEKDASKFKQILRVEIIRALESAVDFEIAEEDDHQ